MNIIIPKNPEIKDILFDCRDIAIKLLDKEDLKNYIIRIPKTLLFRDKQEHSYEEIKEILKTNEWKRPVLKFIENGMDLVVLANFKASMMKGFRSIGCILKKPIHILSPIWRQYQCLKIEAYEESNMIWEYEKTIAKSSLEEVYDGEKVAFGIGVKCDKIIKTIKKENEKTQ